MDARRHLLLAPPVSGVPTNESDALELQPLSHGKRREFYVRIGTGQRVFFAVAAICATMGAVALELTPAPASAYRLSLNDLDSFRLAHRDGYAPAPAPAAGKEAAISAKLVGMPFSAEIDSAARQTSLDPALVHALIYVESRYNPAARSPKGAIGLMQLMPDTASRYGVTRALHAPEANLRAGTRYLSELLTMFDNRLDLALAAYNAGENAVRRHGMRIPPYRETRDYVPAVLAAYNELKEDAPPPVPPRTDGFDYLPGTRLDPASLLVIRDR